MYPRAEAMLGPPFSAFADLGVAAQPVVFADDAVEDVRAELLALDGVVVWVNPLPERSAAAGSGWPGPIRL